jgi:hypothetical protein
MNYKLVITKEWLALGDKTVMEYNRSSMVTANDQMDREYLLIKNLQKHHAIVATLELFDNGESIRKLKIDL